MFIGQNHLNSSQLRCQCWMCTGLNLLDSIWVQAQLKNHPDELWEDGIRDYLAHASNIMEKFSDVVNWLKANASKGGPPADSLATEKKLVPETKNNESKLFLGKTGLVPPTSNTSTKMSWSSGVFSNNQSSGGLLSNSQSSGMFSNNQSSGFFSNSQSTGLFTKNQSSSFSQSTGSFSKSELSGLFSNSQTSAASSPNQSSGLSSNSQNTALFSKSHNTGLFSNSQNSIVSSVNQSSGLFSNSQSAGVAFTNQSSGLFPNSQSSGVSSANQSSGMVSSNQSAPVFFKTPTPFVFGQNSASANHNTSDDVDDENEPEQPGSPSIKKSEEKGIVVVHEVKCKLYVKSSDPADKDTWKDKGTGQLSIKCKEDATKGTKESKPTIIVRNDAGRVLLNALLYPGIKTNSQKNSIVAIFHTAGDDGGNNDNVVARTFLIRMKTEEDRSKLATAIQEYAPAHESKCTM
ncbi:nucleoporin NUP152 isoform X2 [Jatropha curcas]|uniref:nucleoporin NUP152 isoform X2 n=1 Tax=Jatropha curcas TaxID=180498 RepID=UPI0009D70274|nr:nucleoporin NUP152 isoform X2 [Jatropha curcas]